MHAIATNRAATAPGPTTGWWTGAVGYQVYLRSFADSDGDGIGDLRGLHGRLEHLVTLGVDYLWITPFYPSPQADHGYDVADYTDVDPTYGDLASFDAVVSRAHDLGLRVVVDVVPNHSSDRHPWFRDARTGRHARYRDHYVWRDPAPGGGPPNNWVSKFGGPAWTLHPGTGQYYMHTFLPEQPDLNWANPEVREAFDGILEFWLDRGVDGFRIDTAHLLTEDGSFRDNPLVRVPPETADPDAVYFAFDHRYDLDQPDVLDVYRRWQALTAGRDVVLLGEVGLFEAEPVARYVRDGALDLAFYFPTLKTGWDAAEIRRAIVAGTRVGGHALAWPLSSHDDPRAVRRFGGGVQGVDRSLAYLTFLVGLPGSPVFLQGDELGLDPGDQGVQSVRHDPVATRNPGAVGRDASRTPMPWDDGEFHGFSSHEPWLAFPPGTRAMGSVERQRDEPGSPLRRVRELLSVRRRCPDLTGTRPVVWRDEPDQGELLAYRRGDTVVALNLGAEPARLSASWTGVRRFASRDPDASVADQVQVAPDTAVILSCPGR